MASSSLQPLDLLPEPDLHPLYATTTQIASLLSPHSGLSPPQKAELVSHCLTRACVFGDLSTLTYLLTDSQAQSYVDLGAQDEDGLGLVSLMTLGFGSESERDVEREECVRLLVAQGANVNAADNAGWTPLHYAALLAPPTLVSYLSTHGCSLFTETRRRLTALDIVTAHSIVPGRDDVALLLEEAMRSEGWTSGKMEEQRRLTDESVKTKGRQRNIRDNVAKVLGIHPRYWGPDDPFSDSSDDEGDGDDGEEDLFTPPLDFTTMLVFSPSSLPYIFHSLITNFPLSLGNSEPANVLYMLARFACLTCDHTWLEDLINSATDSIEEAVFNQSDDISCLIFWLYNATVWLHLMRCDQSISEACDMLGSFDIVEELINAIFVFIIRFAERKIDQLLDAALLDHSPLSSEFESIQFESEWSFLRSFGAKKKSRQPSPLPSVAGTMRNGNALSSADPSRPPSPPSVSSPNHRSFSSFTQTFSRGRGNSTTPLQSLFQDAPPPPSPANVTSFLTALHTLLTLSGINPALVTQLWSQIMYWTACETFNRILTRKKYLCRSRAIQIGMNLKVLEEWIVKMGLPRGVESHFAPVWDLINWLQCLSSITDFSNLVATIQTMRDLNPLQMRRAVRDYKYEVNEGRMTEECSQYLAQLQKDWERHRVKLGVEALRKEIDERDREYAESESSYLNEESASSRGAPSVSTASSSQISLAQRNVDALFNRSQSAWEPAKPPQVLGELLDSRYMLPLVFPSDPRLLATVARKVPLADEKKRSIQPGDDDSTTESRGLVDWQSKSRTVRKVGVETLRWVDGVRSVARWISSLEPEYFQDEERDRFDSSGSEDGDEEGDDVEDSLSHIPRFTRKPSARSKGRGSVGGEITPIEPD